MVDAITLEEEDRNDAWKLKDGYERADVERYCITIQLLEIKSSPVTWPRQWYPRLHPEDFWIKLIEDIHSAVSFVPLIGGKLVEPIGRFESALAQKLQVTDLWEEALQITGTGLTMRRPIGEATGMAEVLCPEWWKVEVSLEMEVTDSIGRFVVPRSRKKHVQGDGTLPDVVEMSLLCLQPGQSCEVCCQKASLCTLLAESSNLPLYVRIWLLSRSESRNSLHLQVLEHSRLLMKQKRFLLALLKLRSLCTHELLGQFKEEMLKLLCICEHHLGLPAAKVSADALVKGNRNAKYLVLRARINLSSEPSKAVHDLNMASELDPTLVNDRFLRRAKHEMKRERRAKQWFDGRDVEDRIAKARSPDICHQCNRLCNGRKGTSSMDRKYLCQECWTCWSTIRQSQQKELDRQVEKATYSDYSTGTDELPSLDDTPQDWNSRHPMWDRENRDRPNWRRPYESCDSRCLGTWAAILSILGAGRNTATLFSLFGHLKTSENYTTVIWINYILSLLSILSPWVVFPYSFGIQSFQQSNSGFAGMQHSFLYFRCCLGDLSNYLGSSGLDAQFYVAGTLLLISGTGEGMRSWCGRNASPDTFPPYIRSLHPGPWMSWALSRLRVRPKLADTGGWVYTKHQTTSRRPVVQSCGSNRPKSEDSDASDTVNLELPASYC